MASSCIFFIINMPEENPKCGDVIGNPTKESHALGSKVENIDLNDKTATRKSAFKFPKCNCARFRARSASRPAALCLFLFKHSCGHLENFRKVWQLSKRERKGKGYIFGFAFTTQ